MLFSKPIPFTEAIASQQVKKLMPTTATSRELEALAPEIRERARFLSQVDHAGTVAKADQVIRQALGMDGKPINPNQARALMGEYLQSIGYDPENPPEGFAKAKPGSLQDIMSDGRRNLVINTNMQMARGYGDWKQGQNEAILDQWPCWQLVRVASRKEKRDWRSRWVDAGGTLYGPSARMIARKDDPIWKNLGPFHLPYPPFDFNSGMGTRDVDRDTAEELGVIKPSTIVEPQDRGFNQDVTAQLPADISPNLKTALLKAFRADAAALPAAGTLRLVEQAAAATAAIGEVYGTAMAGKEKLLRDFAPVTAGQQARIAEATGLQTEGYSHSLDADGVRHIMRQHGSAAAEASRGQEAITLIDLETLPDVVAYPDTIEPGDVSRKNQTIKYTKQMGGTVHVVEEVWTGKKKLMVKTMWKTKAREQRATQ